MEDGTCPGVPNSSAGVCAPRMSDLDRYIFFIVPGAFFVLAAIAISTFYSKLRYPFHRIDRVDLMGRSIFVLLTTLTLASLIFLTYLRVFPTPPPIPSIRL